MSDVLVWTDVETTGLIPGHDVVLEVGMIATDYELQPIDGVKDLHLVIRPRRLKLLRMDDVPIHMHLHNGLLSECARSHVRGMDAATRISQWLITLRAQSGRLVLAGSSVHFDRRFLDQLHQPFIGHVLAGVDHRMLDVSTLDEIARHLYPDIYEHRPERTTNHRVMACLHDSMALYRYYRERLVCGSVVSGVSDCSGDVSVAQDGPVSCVSDVSASACDEGYLIGLGDGLHGTRNVNPYRGEES